MQGHKDLVVWQKAMDLVGAVYRLTRAFPKEEIYGLRSQISGRRFRFPRTLRKATP